MSRWDITLQVELEKKDLSRNLSLLAIAASLLKKKQQRRTLMRGRMTCLVSYHPYLESVPTDRCFSRIVSHRYCLSHSDYRGSQHINIK
jgi:hypothetical protein